MKTIWFVLSSNGDGSSSIQVVKDKEVLEQMKQLADDGNEYYASGDGLQDKKIEFPDDFDVDTWVKKHFYGYTKMKDLERW